MMEPETRTTGGYGRAGGGEEGPGLGTATAPAQRWVQWAGAAVSGALILGVIVWGYRLAVRDVSGVPIIRAIEGPARIAPADPGGDMAAHVGLAVNEVAGAGFAAPGPERVVLAPAPTGLSPDDAPMSELRPLPEIASAPEAAPPDAEGQPVAIPDSAKPKPTAPEVPADAAAPADTPPAPPAPVPEAATDPAADPAAAPPETAIPADVPGLARSPRPIARPAQDIEAEAAATAVAAALAGPEAVEVEASALPAGTRVVQLGAYDSPELARAEWGHMTERFAALMEGKKRVVQEAASGGRSFWRLRVQGFESVEDARQFCAALVAEGANCIPTLIK